MTHKIHIGQDVWRARRFWVQDVPRATDLRRGWNTSWDPYKVIGITPKRIIVFGNNDRLYLDRQTLERDGKLHHTRYYEYFYVVKPARDPEHVTTHTNGDAFAALGLSPLSTATDVKRAYKRLAHTAHPDRGGSHEAFLQLKTAYESALKSAVR